MPAADQALTVMDKAATALPTAAANIPDAAHSISSGQILTALLLAGLLGMIGQSVRAVVGLKKLNDEATASAASASDLFIASRLVTSQIIGFIAGVIAALSLDITKLLTIADGNLLLGIAAAGYAGTDIIEAFARRLGGASGKGDGGARPPKPSGQGLPPIALRSQLARNQFEAYQAARGENLSDAAARALVANMTGESLAKPNDFHWDVSHNAQGIVQWDPPRSQAIKQQFGADPKDMSVAEQTQAAIWEIRTNPRFAKSKAAIETGTNASQIIDVLVRNYEVPRDPDGQVARRVAYLQSLSRVIDQRALA